MNKIEKVVYDLVKANPWVKNMLRNIYQGAYDLLPRKKNILPINYSLKEGFFYGFHDTSPFSVDMTKVLANKPEVFHEMPGEKDLLKVGFFDFKDGQLLDFHELGHSSAWNHHKGCRLQWLDERHVIFNSGKGRLPVSAIVNIVSGTGRYLDFPIDTVSTDGKWATSFSYQRLEALMPGYGYLNKTDDAFLSENAPAQTGLFLIDVEANTRTLLVSLQELADHVGERDIHRFRHYVTHSEFSFDGRYISFLHRWVGTDVMKRWSRLIIFDREKSIFFAAPTDGMVSHYVWNGKNQIVAYCRVDGVDGHVLFDIPDIGNHVFVAHDRLNSDGHQSFINDHEFVTDTYPDKFRMAKIFKVSVTDDTADLIASVYSPKSYQSVLPYRHIACDLHPRVSRDGRFVCFDTPTTGIRSICVIPI